jgi:hypothetical protein
MIDVQIFFHQSGMAVYQLPAVPRVGEFIRDGGDNAYKVASVLWQPAGRVKIFAIPLNRDRAHELENDWAAWGERQTANAEKGD